MIAVHMADGDKIYALGRDLQIFQRQQGRCSTVEQEARAARFNKIAAVTPTAAVKGIARAEYRNSHRLLTRV